MPRTALERCNVTDAEKRWNVSYHQNSRVWNGLIHPLTRLRIKGILFYQGESESVNHDLAHISRYSCSFPSLISFWRRRWRQLHPVNFPFGFVQMHALTKGKNIPLFRHLQTAGRGTVPNDVMPATFMAVTVDTYDNSSEMHPMHKKVMAERLSIAGAKVAYGLKGFRENGPFPKSMTRKSNTISINYGEELLFKRLPKSGFQVCCNSSFTICHGQSWVAIAASKMNLFDIGVVQIDLSGECPAGKLPAGLAYMFENIPVISYLGAPIYSDDRFHLPGLPWKWDLGMVPEEGEKARISS